MVQGKRKTRWMKEKEKIEEKNKDSEGETMKRN